MLGVNDTISLVCCRDGRTGYATGVNGFRLRSTKRQKEQQRLPTVSATKKDAPIRAASVKADSLTPAMRQYVEQKKRVGDAVLLFRMGDFYETFYEDAVLCSEVLGIALTARSKGDHPIPLAGIPYHALDAYLKKLVDAGHKVAISEQLEDAKQAKGVVKRDVVRIVTAGTLTEDTLLSDKDANILASVFAQGDAVGLAFVELSSGRFEAIDVSKDSILDELVRNRPAEVVIDDDRGGIANKIVEELRVFQDVTVTSRPLHEFSAYQAEKSLLEHFDVATLSGFGFDEMNASLCAAGCLIQYLQETQRTSLAHIASIARRAVTHYLQIDHSSGRALEIERTLRSGSREGSMLAAIDRTVHPLGSRTLLHWIRTPLIDVAEIELRQEAVGFFVENEPLRSRMHKSLKTLADVERIASRVALGRAGPRDLASLGRTLDQIPAMAGELRQTSSRMVEAVAAGLLCPDALIALLKRSIREEPAPTLRDGGVIADGFNEELDRLRSIAHDGQAWLTEFQRKESERIGVSTLKVGFHRVFGYYIEVSNSAQVDIPPDYIRKQTVKNAERYITEELKTHESEVLTASDRANELERQLFERVCADVAKNIQELLRIAGAIGRLDCLCCFAELAVDRRFVRPEIVDGLVLDIDEGRHVVLDQALGDQFVPNDTRMLDESSRVFVITGPNMAGKSTYIRQVALMTLLAQTGSFVPARRMQFTPVDRIFARVGAADELMRGQSTFMVEMTEAANILHNATDRSLVIIDELGRGTSTFDGLSLAWAITEHLANQTKCRSFVATHYHEMAELESLLKGVRNYNVAVRESRVVEDQDEGIVFLHRIVEGGASKSYGVHVAKLAGIPKPVIRRSREVLEELQRGFERESRTPQFAKEKTKDDAQLKLFRDPGDEIRDELRLLDPDKITPLEALQIIQAWKDRHGS